MRVVGSVSAALVVLAAAIVNPRPQAAVQIDLTINFIPGNPVFPESHHRQSRRSSATQLTGDAAFPFRYRRAMGQPTSCGRVRHRHADGD